MFPRCPGPRATMAFTLGRSAPTGTSASQGRAGVGPPWSGTYRPTDSCPVPWLSPRTLRQLQTSSREALASAP